MSDKIEVMVGDKLVELDKDYIPNEKEEYMNIKQRAYFKKILLDLVDEIDIENKNALDKLSSAVMDTHAVDEVDMANITEENLSILRSWDRKRKYLARINGVIKRIDSDDFGYCQETGEEIGIPRLLARPITRYCVEVQERLEREERDMEHIEANDIEENDDLDECEEFDTDEEDENLYIM